MDKRTFLRISIAGAAGALFVPRELMADMVEPALKTRLAGGIYHTDVAFGRWNKTVAGLHLATFRKEGTQLHVASDHPMIAYKHYIIKHEIFNSDFRFIAEHRYDPTKDKKPEATFDTAGHTGLIYVLTMCNVHDVWVDATEV